VFELKILNCYVVGRGLEKAPALSIMLEYTADGKNGKGAIWGSSSP